jgi:hypothetical protein
MQDDRCGQRRIAAMVVSAGRCQLAIPESLRSRERTRTSNQTVICRDTSEPGLASLIYRRSGRGSCTRCSVFLRVDRSFRPFRAFSYRAGVLNAQSWRLIIVWLEVRVLPAPPRSRHQTEISRFFMKSPELAGIRARILSLQAVDWISGAVLGPLSLPCKIAFPHGRGRCWWRLGTFASARRRYSRSARPHSSHADALPPPHRHTPVPRGRYELHDGTGETLLRLDFCNG